ncbi:Hypothetical predicted protein [Paramuricea clavata]|uniref:Uncharacterized protein n=1 Tax=Paramuricea clavata TaxID=317549 RepID=A0A6S7I9L9_PARCT|nr:Hypothetical predicted protein [Paramuricea clavata]
MDNIDIIFDELKRNEIDVDKQTLWIHINTMINQHRDIYREMNTHDLNLEQVYREINVTNFGRILTRGVDQYRGVGPQTSMAEKYLNQLYYNPESPASFGGVHSIYRALKNEGKYQILTTHLLKFVFKYYLEENGTATSENTWRDRFMADLENEEVNRQLCAVAVDDLFESWSPETQECMLAEWNVAKCLHDPTT